MDSTSPAPASTVGSTSANAVVATAAFAFGLVTRLLRAWQTPLRAPTDGTGGNHASASGSPP